MGINGLLKNTRSVGKKKHITQYKNKKVAVDGYSWMHKALYKCSLEIYNDKNIDGIIQYFSKRISYFLKLKIKIVLVFDGDDLPLKKMTNVKRKGNRQNKLIQAQQNIQDNDLKEARKNLALSLDVTPDMVYTLKQNLQLKFPQGVEFLVAPYEADSQLAFLSKIKYVDVVISEDSDLLVFGALEVFYKMDKNYYGDVYKQEDLKNCQEINLCNWSFDKFIQMCVLSGCDYLSSPKGVGFKTAYQLLNKYKNIERVVEILKNNLEQQYYDKFLYAYLAFKFSRVYCPVDKRIVPLNPLDFSNHTIQNSFDLYAVQKVKQQLGNFDFLGIDHGQEISTQIATCQIHPKSKKQFEKNYLSQQNIQSKNLNYHKRKLSLKLKKVVSLFQINEHQKKQIQIKKIIKKETCDDEINYSSSSFNQQKKQCLIQDRNKDQKQCNQINDGLKVQKCSSKDSTDYDSFLEDFLTQNKNLKIDCKNILNIFEKSLQGVNQICQKFVLFFKL